MEAADTSLVGEGEADEVKTLVAAGVDAEVRQPPHHRPRAQVRHPRQRQVTIDPQEALA